MAFPVRSWKLHETDLKGYNPTQTRLKLHPFTFKYPSSTHHDILPALPVPVRSRTWKASRAPSAVLYLNQESLKGDFRDPSVCRTGAGESRLALQELGAQSPRDKSASKAPAEVPAVSQPLRPAQLRRTPPTPWGTRGCTGLARARRSPRDSGPRRQPPPAAPGCPSASRGSAASEQLRAAGLGRPRPLSTLPLRPRPPLAGGPSAWPDTWQLTGAVLGPRRGGGGGRGAGACRGPRLREAEGAAAASLVRAERSARAAAPQKAGWARGRPSV